METENSKSLSNKWLRTESRRVRPFRYSESLLQKIGTRIYQEDDFLDSDSIRKDEFEIDKISPEIRFDFDPSIMHTQLDLNNEMVRVIVSIEDKALKQVHLALNLSIEECVGEDIPIPVDICKRVSWADEVILTIAIVLANNRNVDFGEARLAGQWIAKKEISIGRYKDSVTFKVISRSPEWFKDHKLPAETTYLVDVDEDLNQACEQLPELVSVNVNETIIPIIAKSDTSSIGRAILRSVYCDTAATILSAGLANIESEDELIENGILKVVVNKIAGSIGVEVSDIIKAAKTPGSSKLRALIQTEADLTKAIKSINLKG